MHVEHHHLPGHAIGRPMEVREFGHHGQPVVVFPSQDGRAWDFEGFGMIEACAHLIEAGRVRLFVVDVGSSRVDLQACKLEYSIVSPK